ncbi:hypothetical protein [Tenacibaculum halocynthiae]|uniref:hypothetical protein n=1 Tax=Tenacibaculum halocynthiae TaxID=1254437 RepID=UPI003D659839
MSNWIKILKGHLEGKFYLYDHGLTLRLLVGASQNPIGGKFEDPIKAKEATRAIFDEMKSYNKDNLIVTSNPCYNVKGFVMHFKEEELTDNSIGVNFKDIWEAYGEQINNGNYGITQEDRKIINQILERDL